MIDAKQYLREIRTKRQHVERLKKRREELHLDVSFGSVDYSADKIQTTPENKLENALIKLSDRIESIDTDIVRITMEIDDRLNSIESLQDSNLRSVLFKRYSEYKSFEQISIEMGYVYNYICNLHGEALKEISKLLN